MFDKVASMRDPINLSIGQPDFDVPEPIKDAAIEAIRQGKNGYTVTQGIAPLREKLQSRVDALGHEDRRVLVTSGTSGSVRGLSDQSVFASRASFVAVDASTERGSGAPVPPISQSH